MKVDEIPFVVQPWGRYLAKDWDPVTQKIYEASRNGRDATTINVQRQSCIGNGIVGPNVVCLYGSTNSSITWPTGSLPSQFTLCSLARYPTTGLKRRIFQGKRVNFVHGFYNAGNRRTHYYNDVFMYDQTGYVITDWCNDCGTNNIGPGSPNHAIINNIKKVSNVFTYLKYLPTDTLTINNSLNNSENSDFEFNQITIWDRQLSYSELAMESNKIQQYMAEGDVSTSEIGPNKQKKDKDKVKAKDV